MCLLEDQTAMLLYPQKEKRTNAVNITIKEMQGMKFILACLLVQQKQTKALAKAVKEYNSLMHGQHLTNHCAHVYWTTSSVVSPNTGTALENTQA